MNINNKITVSISKHEDEFLMNTICLLQDICDNFSTCEDCPLQRHTYDIDICPKAMLVNLRKEFGIINDSDTIC